jgi:hypothetical protein
LEKDGNTFFKVFEKSDMAVYICYGMFLDEEQMLDSDELETEEAGLSIVETEEEEEYLLFDNTTVIIDKALVESLVRDPQSAVWNTPDTDGANIIRELAERFGVIPAWIVFTDVHSLFHGRKSECSSNNTLGEAEHIKSDNCGIACIA